MKVDEHLLAQSKNKYQIEFSKDIMSSNAILQVLSMYKQLVDFELFDNETKYKIELKVKNSSSYMNFADFISKLRSEFTDQQVRIDLQKEFGELRNTIVRYAFFPAEEIGKKKVLDNHHNLNM